MTLALRVSGAVADPALDTRLEVFGPLGSGAPASVAQSDDGADDVQAPPVSFVAPEDGTYLVVLSTWEDPTHWSYSLSLECEGRCEAPVPPWSLETIAERGHTGDHPRLVLDAAGTPSVLYYDWDDDGGRLIFEQRAASGQWRARAVSEPFSESGRYGANYLSARAGVAMDASGVAHFAYRKGFGRIGGPRSWATHVRMDESGTRREDLHGTPRWERASRVWEDATIAIDAAGTPHVFSTHLVPRRDGEYGFTTELWHETVGEGGTRERITTADHPYLWAIRLGNAVVDAEDDLHLTYITQDELVHATRTEAGWDHRTLAPRGSRLVSPVVRLGPEGEPRLLYIAEQAGNSTLHYAEPDEADDAWTVEVVSTEALLGGQDAIGLDIDGDGEPHVAFIAGYDQIHYGRRIGDTWSVEVLDEPSVHAQDLSLAVSRELPPTVHIAFHNPRFDDVQLLTR